MKIIFLYWDNVTRNGNKLTNELNAAPPAIVATIIGNAQQIKVPDEEKSAIISKNLFLFMTKYPSSHFY